MSEMMMYLRQAAKSKCIGVLNAQSQSLCKPFEKDPAIRRVQTSNRPVDRWPRGMFPPYCCVILTREDDERTIFVEERDPKANVAAGRLTCFGV